MTQDLIKINTSIPDVVVVTMNRPEKRNALSIKLMKELIEAIGTHANTCKAMVFAAEGPVFSAGMDLQEAVDPKSMNVLSYSIAELFTAIALAPCATICAIQGDVLAGGVGIAMAADYALIIEGARVSFPEVKKGIVPALVSVILRRQIPMRYVRELLIFGMPISAERALSIGVVNQIVYGESVLSEAIACAKQVASGELSSIQILKKLLLHLDPASLKEEVYMALEVHKGARKKTAQDAPKEGP